MFVKNHKMAFFYLLYILFFLLGAFVSGIITEWLIEAKMLFSVSNS
ncbi:hypothetical protein [Chryseobacterium rhizoplanae]|nr:hypothetical protein [Chryseobacterium rhizoplanae]